MSVELGLLSLPRAVVDLLVVLRLEELVLDPSLVVVEFQLVLEADHMGRADVVDRAALEACMVDWGLVAFGLAGILVQDKVNNPLEAVHWPVQHIVQTVASVVQDIVHIVALEDVDRAGFGEHQELDDDKDQEEFDTAGLVEVDRTLEDNQVDRVDFVVDILRNH